MNVSLVILWGNVPALGLLNLQQNKGIQFAEDLRLLYACDSCFLGLYCSLTPLHCLKT